MTFNLYGLILGLAILASFQASLWLAKERKVDIKVVEGLFWWVVIGGIVGARLYHVVDKWQEIYSLNPQSAFYIWNGGLGIWGAIIGGIIGLWLGKRFLHYGRNDKGGGRNELLDIVFFGLPLGQAIGRWGNFFNNEIVGKNGEPLFLYESVLNLVLFGILVSLAKRDSSTTVGMTKRGIIAGIYLIGYGLIRFLLEPLRPDSIVWKIGGLPAAQIFSAAALGIGAYLILRKRS